MRKFTHELINYFLLRTRALKKSFLILDPFFRKDRVCLYESLTNFKVTEFIFDVPERKNTHGFERKKYAQF